MLHRYLLGKLPNLSMDSVEQHLAICESCAQRSYQLQPRDQLVELVSTASSLGDSWSALTAHPTTERLAESDGQTNSDLASSTTHAHDELPPTPQLPNQSRYQIIRFLGSGSHPLPSGGKRQLMRLPSGDGGHPAGQVALPNYFWLRIALNETQQFLGSARPFWPL